jgi:hypothetical protein
VVGLKLLCLSLVGFVLALDVAQVAFADDDRCTNIQLREGLCHVHGSIGNGSENIGGRATTPGAPSSPPDGDGFVTDPIATTPVPGPGDPGFVFRDPFGVINPVTMSDLRRFHPKAGGDHMQPAGWAVVGLSTNFYSTVGEQVLRGRLLKHHVVVRFTPVGWRWSYGDGTSRLLSMPGSTWESQRVLEFDPTPTSHIYTARGDFTIRLGIEFTAEYRFANGDWTPVTGILTVPAKPLAITVGDATTVLVGEDCSANPAGPGC